MVVRSVLLIDRVAGWVKILEIFIKFMDGQLMTFFIHCLLDKSYRVFWIQYAFSGCLLSENFKCSHRIDNY